MKVFQINTVCGSGSTGRIAVDLSKMLKEKGNQCCIAYSRGVAPANVESYRFGNKLEIYWHGIMTRITDRHGMYSKRATKKLIAKIREYNPDIIHLHNVHGYYLNIKLLFEFLASYRKPVVWTLHDCWSYTGHCSHYTCVSCDKWMNQCSECPLKKDYPGSLFLDNSVRNYLDKKDLFTSIEQLHLVTPSHWLKEEVEKSFFGQKSALHPNGIACTAVPNGIDITKFVYTASDKRKELGIDNKKVILGVANVWTMQKGFVDFIELAKELDESYQIVMVGVDKKRSEQLPKNIIALERTKNIEELIEFYSIADVYFNSSIEETMGMTTGEAICCGTPVVAYRSTAVPESVGEGCGIVVEAGNVRAAKKAIVEICANKKQYKEACMSYREQFEISKAHESYYSIYRMMLEKRN